MKIDMKSFNERLVAKPWKSGYLIEQAMKTPPTDPETRKLMDIIYSHIQKKRNLAMSLNKTGMDAAELGRIADAVKTDIYSVASSKGANGARVKHIIALAKKHRAERLAAFGHYPPKPADPQGELFHMEQPHDKEAEAGIVARILRRYDELLGR